MPQRTWRASSVGVKSSMRTFDILEYCDLVQRPVAIAELVARLGFPQSSTSALVQSMINRGYLVLAGDGRSFTPSSRVSALARWIEPAVPRAEIRATMQAVADATGQTVILGVPDDLCVRYLDAIPGRQPMRLDIAAGDRLPLVESGMGRLLLSCMPDAEIERIVRGTRERLAVSGPQAVAASNLADLWNENPVVPTLTALKDACAEIRRRGYAVSVDRVTSGAGIVCVPLPTPPGEVPMGLGVGGLSTSIARHEKAILQSLMGGVSGLRTVGGRSV